MKDYYSVLGVSKDASKDELKKAKNRAKKDSVSFIKNSTLDFSIYQ